MQKKMESTKEKVRNRDSVNVSNVCLLGVLQLKNGVKLFGEIKDETKFWKTPIHRLKKPHKFQG